MPYYLCSNSDGLHACCSWEQAKKMTHGRSGSWVKKYSRRDKLEAAIAQTRHVPREAPSSAEAAAGSTENAYTDGSCVLHEWSACAVYFGPDSRDNAVVELPAPHTAPRAELAAVLLCLQKGFRRGRIFTDSTFVCRAFSRGWPEAYAHQDLVQSIRSLWTQELSIAKVPAHAGVPGNEAVDAMLRSRLLARPARPPPPALPPLASAPLEAHEGRPMAPQAHAGSQDLLWRDF